MSTFVCEVCAEGLPAERAAPQGKGWELGLSLIFLAVALLSAAVNGYFETRFYGAGFTAAAFYVEACRRYFVYWATKSGSE